MRHLLLLAALLSTSTAQAEVRFFNATGEPLTVDVVHAEGKVEGIQLSADRGITKAYGPDIGNDDAHMVVVRDAAGKEVLREKMVGNRIHVIRYWGTSDTVTTVDVGIYKGKEFDMAKIGLINSTGQELHYRVERPDASVQEEDSDPNGPKDVHYQKLYNLGKKTGVAYAVEISGETLPKTSHQLVTGGLYHISRGKGGIAVELVADASKGDPVPAEPVEASGE